MASTVNMRSGFRAVGALRSDAGGAQEPLALETTVVATGARPGDTTAKRELFTEETQTVLVFENGAVIRLSAAVADGQLLFLTNKKTGKEVVTQVIRKRSFRPTSCYVDLEFTEPSPGFWGIEFPKAAASSPAAAIVAADPEEGQATGASPTPPPNVHEVERLKGEVAELQNKLKSLIADGQSPVVATGRASTASPETTTPSAPEMSEELAKTKGGEKALEQLLAQEAEQESLHGPKRLVSYPKKSSTSAIVKRAGSVATAGAFAAVIVAAGIAAYRFGLLDSFIGKTTAATAVPAHAAAVAAPSARPATNTEPPAVSPTPSVSNPAPVADLASQPTSDTKGLPEAKSAGDGILGADSGDILPTVVIPRSRRSKANVSATSAAPREPRRSAGRTGSGLTATSSAPLASGARPSAASSENEMAAGGGSEDYSGPKLLHAVKPVSPPEALRNYITGNVSLDALVDATGHVKSVTVISGPYKLRKTAIEDMKQYVYEPARKNGKAVASHVQTSLQFWYEP